MFKKIYERKLTMNSWGVQEVENNGGVIQLIQAKGADPNRLTADYHSSENKIELVNFNFIFQSL